MIDINQYKDQGKLFSNELQNSQNKESHKV